MKRRDDYNSFKENDDLLYPVPLDDKLSDDVGWNTKSFLII